MPRVAFPHLSLALVLVSACSKEPEPAPKVEPGPRVDKTLAKLGGVTLNLPDNLTIASEGPSRGATAASYGGGPVGPDGDNPDG